MMLIYLLAEGMATICESCICYCLLDLIFDVKADKKRTVILVALVSAFVLFLNNYQLYSSVNLLCAIIFVTLTESFFCKTALIQTFAAAMFFAIFLNTIDLFVLSCLGVFGNGENWGTHMTAGFSQYRLIFLFISKTLLMGVYLLLKKYIQIFNYLFKKRRLLIIAIIGFIGILRMIQITLNDINAGILLVWGFLLGSIIVIFYAFYFYACYISERANNEYIRFHDSMVLSQYSELLNSYKINSQNFHDLRNHMSTIYNLLDTGNWERAKEYVSEFIEVKENFEVSWTGNEIIDYVLNLKKMKAERQTICFSIDTDVIKYNKVGDKAICTILSNLLDNSIEACSLSNEKKSYINVVIRAINNMLVIKVKNSSHKKPIKKNNMLLTSKPDTNRHGWGMSSVISAVEDNNGIVSYYDDDKSFTVDITFF